MSRCVSSRNVTSLRVTLLLAALGLACASPATDLLGSGDYARAYAAAVQAGDALTASRAALDQGMYRNEDTALWFSRATEQGRRAVKQAPDSAEAHYHLGSALGQQANVSSSLFGALGLARECRSEYDRALSLNPNLSEARVALARWHSAAYARAGRVSGGNPETARQLATQTLQGGSGNIYTLTMAAYVYFDLKDRTRALPLMQKALKLPPRTAEEKDLQAQAAAFLAAQK